MGYSIAKRQMIQSFKETVEVSGKIATEFLRRSNWNLGVALDNFYNEGNAGGTVSSSTKILHEELFNKYCDGGSEENVVDPLGIEKFCEDLEVETDDIILLALAWKMEAKINAQFSKEEWMLGMEELEVESLVDLKTRVLPELRREITSGHSFKELYEFSFQFTKDDPKQLYLATEVAAGLWQVLLGDRWPMLKDFLEFLEVRKPRSINRDTWNLTLDFSIKFSVSLTNYDPTAAFPVLLDEFVEWYQDRKV